MTRAQRSPWDAAAARVAYEAMTRHYATPSGLMRETYPVELRYPSALLWPLSQAIDATIAAAVAGLTPSASADLSARLAALDRYWDGRRGDGGYTPGLPFPQGWGRGDKYYDDNAWIGLDLVHAYHVTGDPALLQRAEEVFDFLLLGWDDDPAAVAPGGERWTQASGRLSRHTVSTAGAAQVALQLHLATGRPEYLEWGKRMVEWVDATLRAPNNLYWDNIQPSGQIDRMQWTYNQGLMLGAHLLIHVATGDRGALQRAAEIADDTLANLPGDRLLTHSIPFNAIFFKNLLMLDSVMPQARWRTAAEGYATAIAARHLDPATGLHIKQRGTLLEQAALALLPAYLALTRAELRKVLGTIPRQRGGAAPKAPAARPDRGLD